MLHLRHCTYLSLHSPSSSSFDKPKKFIFLSGSGVDGAKELLGLRKIRKNGAMDNDSEFEVDRDKAREALRKLDEQLQSLSKKQANVPKIRAADLKQSSARKDEEVSEFSESFLSYAASALLIFTILYNFIFYTVIKPSVDGPEQPAQESAPLQQPSARSEFPLRP